MSMTLATALPRSFGLRSEGHVQPSLKSCLGYNASAMEIGIDKIIQERVIVHVVVETWIVVYIDQFRSTFSLSMLSFWFLAFTIVDF